MGNNDQTRNTKLAKAVKTEVLEAKADSLVAECSKISDEIVNLKELVNNLQYKH